MKNRRMSAVSLAVLGMMTALVFVSNYLRIILPIAIGGKTSFPNGYSLPSKRYRSR